MLAGLPLATPGEPRSIFSIASNLGFAKTDIDLGLPAEVVCEEVAVDADEVTVLRDAVVVVEAGLEEEVTSGVIPKSPWSNRSPTVILRRYAVI